jgi:hypothetical protein
VIDVKEEAKKQLSELDTKLQAGRWLLIAFYLSHAS